MSTLLLTVGDTAPSLTGVCKNGDTPANLVGVTSAEIHILKPAGDPIARDVDTSDDPENGAWSLEWEEGDLDVAGTYEAELEVTYSNDQVQTFGPVSFVVRAQLA